MSALDDTVEMLREMLPLLSDDVESLCDTLAAAVTGSNGAFSALQLVHKLVKAGMLSQNKAGVALKVQQRACGHLAVSPAQAQASAAPVVASAASPRAVVVASAVRVTCKSSSGEVSPTTLAAQASPTTRALPASALSGGQLDIVQRALQQLTEQPPPPTTAQWRSPRQSSSLATAEPKKAAKRPSPATSLDSNHSSVLSASTTLESGSDLPPHARIFGKIPSDQGARDALAVGSVEAQLKAMRDAQQAPYRPLGLDVDAIPAAAGAGASPTMSSGRSSLVVAAPVRAAGSMDPLLQSWSPKQLAAAANDSFDQPSSLNNSNGQINVNELMDESMQSMASLLLDDSKSDRSHDKIGLTPNGTFDNTNYSIDMSISDGTMSQIVAMCTASATPS